MIESPREQLLKICIKLMHKKGFLEEKHKNRLKKEISEIDSQIEHEYFLNLYNKNYKFPSNENNLFISYLLGLVDDIDFDKEPAYQQGEFPDIDVDYLPVIQDYLRNEWCPKTFGRDNVVNIGNYGTFGIKSALLDMTRVHGIDRSEIQFITKNLQDKDEEGRPITWDKALEITPDLQEYAKKYPDVTDAAKRIINRIRNRGKHAGGTVISSSKIDDLVPIMVDTDGNPVSGWTEGLHDQDLQPVGLIKFDILAIKDLLRIATCCDLIKKRRGIKSISSFENYSDWTDTSYLNDPKAIFLANESKTRGIFQFDGEGMRNLLKAGGVDCFEDLVAYTALFRPGPLNCKMHERYIARKRGKENWENEVPECVRPILSKTYGVIIYQEQVMKILNVIGDIPLIHCEMVRKAMSKKKIEQFLKYKQMFLENGSKKTGWPISSDDNRNMNFIWNLIESFSAYGFNKSHACAYTFISSRLLYLKAHYPLEFFVTTFSLENDENKLRSYKREAEKLGIRVNRCNLNKSKSNFEIIDNEIYIGFSNIKGIGKEIAEKIVENQPYKNLEDFLNRTTLDKRIVEPLILLNVFEDKDVAFSLKFYDQFKKKSKSNQDREKRQLKRREDLLDTLRSFLKPLDSENSKFVQHDFIIDMYNNSGSDEFNAMYSNLVLKEFQLNDVWQVIKKYAKAVNSFNQKIELEKEYSAELIQSGGEEEIKLNQFEIEKKYYGFSWQHPLEKSPDFIGDYSFSRFKDDETIGEGGVEVVVTKPPMPKSSKNGKTNYYCVLVEDEDWNTEMIIFWQADYERFKEELDYWDEENKRGNFLKIRVTRPSNGFKSYTFQSPPKKDRYLLPEKERDFRLQVMRTQI
jgi:hypothetical protein